MRSKLAVVVPWLIVVGVFLACASQPPSTSPAAPDVSGPPISQGGPGLSPASPAPIGTAVEPAKGWTVVVTEANINADAAMAAVNQFNRPQPGGRFVLVNLGIRNGTDRAAPPMTALKLSVLSGGVANTNSFDVVPAPKLDLSATMQPTATMQGWLPFQVPAAATDVVLLVEPFMTLDQMKDQRFMALS